MTLQTHQYWTSTEGTRFQVLATWNPNEEYDPWVEYRNTHTGEVYTCRLEAFESRFFPQPE